MSSRRYPRIGSRARVRAHEANRNCLVCGARAEYRVDVQFGWLRGDDEVAIVCWRHSQATGAAELFEALAKREQF